MVLGAGGAVGSSEPPEAPSTAAAAPGRRVSFAGLAEETAGLHAPLTGVFGVSAGRGDLSRGDGGAGG